MSNESAVTPVQNFKVERRLYPRGSYDAAHRIAYWPEGAALESLTFTEFPLYDCSPDGFSFWSLDLPQAPTLVIEIRDGALVQLLKAHVRNVLTIDESEKPLYRLGCKFAGRVGVRRLPQANAAPSATVEEIEPVAQPV